MKNTLLPGLFIATVFAFTGCSSDVEQELSPAPTNSTFVEAPKCDGTVSVRINNPESRASNIDGTQTNYTATRCDASPGSFVIVSYHGRNTEQIGMVQIFARNKAGEYTVVSELDMLDARVNYVQYRKDPEGSNKGTAYIGVDRTGKGGVLCGIIAVPMEGNKFKGSGEEMTFTPYKVTGQSINCIKYTGRFTTTSTGDKVLFVASGGNEGLGADGLAGFTKFGINPENPTQLQVLAEKTSTNYRGYWFSYDYLNVSPISYTYRTIASNGNLVYRMGFIANAEARTLLNNDALFFDNANVIETTVYERDDTQVDLGRFSTSSFNIGGSNYMVVSTGTKAGGVQVYRHNGADNTLVNVDTWEKACNNTSSLFTDEDGRNYIFASAGDGVYKLEIIRDEATKAVKIQPVSKRKTTVMTADGTLSSTNYVQMLNSKVYVAGGYEGFYVLDCNDAAFTPVDPAK